MSRRRIKQIIAVAVLAVLLVVVTGLMFKIFKRKESKLTLTELALNNTNLYGVQAEAVVEELRGYQLRVSIQRVVSSPEGNTLKDEEKVVNVTAAIITRLVKDDHGLVSTIPATYDDLKKAQQVIVHADENIYANRTFNATKVEIIQ